MLNDKKALYETIADRLEEMILNDRSRIEQKLPSEQRLAESFSVSRPVIREALKLLKERGLIESRQGVASVVVEYSPERLFKSLSRFTQTQNTKPEQIHQVRTALELLAVRIAAENVTEQDVQNLKTCNQKLQQNLCKSLQAELDIAFHRTIVKISNNPLLDVIFESLTAIMKPIIEKSTTQDTLADGVVWHEKIIHALADKNQEQALTLMQQHLLLSIRNFEYLNE